MLAGRGRFPGGARVPDRLDQGDLEIVEVDGLHQEVDGPAVHRRADVGQVAIGGHDHRLQEAVAFLDVCQQGQPVHARHVDVGHHHLDGRIGVQPVERIGAVTSKQELILLLPDLLAESLPHQQLQVGLIIHDKDPGCHHNSPRLAGY